METIYEKYMALPIDKGLLCLENGDITEPYFCYPVNAKPIGFEGCIDLLIELSCILHVSTDYLLMGSEPSKEEVKNDLLSIISELSTIAKKI